jgi:tRNA pseudouridine38-40 synthase
MRILLTLQYLGTRYAGWQTQSNAVGVQQIVEEVLSRVYETPLRVEGAGRTDAGVHARGQRAHADVPFLIDARGFVLGINNLLPHDIRVVAADSVEDTFHCRFAAKSKTYVYQIWNTSVADVFAFATHAHVAQKLDAARMHAGAQALLGLHDFQAFTVASPEVSTTWRTIEAITVDRVDDAVRITVTADGFLRYMVRRIAGSLIEAGRGKLDDVGASLEPRFEPARWTAPPKGLVLETIRY